METAILILLAVNSVLLLAILLRSGGSKDSDQKDGIDHALIEAVTNQSATFAREMARLIAQCDERVKAIMRYADKANDRLMAVRYPANYANMRAHSGIIEGAQLSTKAHYLDETEVADELARTRKRQDREKDALKELRESLAGEPTKTEHHSIGTVLDFERPVNGSTP